MMPSMVRHTLVAVVALGLIAQSLSAQVPQAPTITVAGVIYANYSYALKADSTLKPVAHGNNFELSRAYIRVLGKLPQGVQTQITVDVDGRKAASNQQSFRLKYAFVSWTPEKSPLTYKIGMIHTPWNDFEESMWDYRMQGTIPMERAGYITSSDIGVGVDGMWGYDKIALQAGVYNGEGYSNAPGDQRKDVEARLSVRLMRTDLAGRLGGLRLSGYAQIGKANGGGTRQRFIGMLSYKTKLVTLAAQAGFATDSTSAAQPKQKGRVLAAFGVLKLGDSSKVSLIGRVDQVDPNTDSVSTVPATRLAVNKQTRIIAGVSYVLSPNLRLLADVDLNSVAGGSPTNAFDKGRQQLFLHTEVKF